MAAKRALAGVFAWAPFRGWLRFSGYRLEVEEETITPVEVRSHRAELTDIEFPSRDGFILKPHVMVEYQVKLEKAPEVLVRLSDEGEERG